MSTSPPCKRKCCYRPFSSKDSPQSCHSDSGPPALLMGICVDVYLTTGGDFGSYRFTNTCVLDSLLAAFHFSYIKYPNIKMLLELDSSLSIIMAYLNARKFGYAKAFWTRQLKWFPENKILDCKSCVKDHFPMFAKLVCAEVDYRQETPNDSAIYETLNKFRALGDVKALGNAEDPALILVNRDVNSNFPKMPLTVEDDNKRLFELQFLLLGERSHMVMCFNLWDNIWVLYDNDPSCFQYFNFEEELGRYGIFLAGYVNTTQANKLKLGISETGTGAQPLGAGSSGQHEIPDSAMEEILMQLGDLSCGTSDSE